MNLFNLPGHNYGILGKRNRVFVDEHTQQCDVHHTVTLTLLAGIGWKC